MYQGHHQDGSSIQKHSAGSMYPFVFRTQEYHEGRFEGIGFAEIIDSTGKVLVSYPWHLDGPAFSVKERRLAAYEKAMRDGDRLAEQHRNHTLQPHLRPKSEW